MRGRAYGRDPVTGGCADFALISRLRRQLSPDGEAQRVEKPPSAWEVHRRGGGSEPCHSPEYLGHTYSSLPHRLRAEPPHRGGQGVSTPFFDSLGFPLGGSCPQSGLMRAKSSTADHNRAIPVSSPLIRPCGATFSLRAKSRLRRLRFDTRLRAQPRGGSLRDAKKRTLSRPLSVSNNLPLRDRLPRYGGRWRLRQRGSGAP